MTEQVVINKTISFVKKELEHAEGGHDWWHVKRVYNVAKIIAATEPVNNFIVELSALLHDIADAKFHGGDENIGPKKAVEFLDGLSVEKNIVVHIGKIIKNISFKGGNFTQQFFSPELAVVQDADRLDALGAIGIARAFNYGGFKNRQMYDPSIKPELNMTKDEYKKSSTPTINHFYEKLLLLKDRMNTKTGKELAEKRHVYMQSFLEQFYDEWEGKK